MSTNTSIDDLRSSLHWAERNGRLTADMVQALIDQESGRMIPRKSMLSMLNNFLNKAKKQKEVS